MNREGVRSPFFLRRSVALTIWRWIFNLSILGIFLLIIFNRFDLSIHIYLAGESSLLNNFGLLVTAVILILFFTSTIHELGHLLAGRLAHLKFHLLIIGPLHIARSKTGVSFGWQWGNAMFNGLAACIPEEMDDLRRRMLYFAAGGPLASFLLMIGAGLVAFSLNENRVVQREYFWMWECALFTTIVSYFFFLTSMKPGMYHTGLPADGSRILMLLRNDLEAERWCALVALNSADIQGVRPFAWDDHLLHFSTKLEDHSYDYLMLNLMQYQALLDKGDIEQSLHVLDHIMQLQIAWESGVRALLALEQAYIYGRYYQDAAKAEDWLRQVKQNRSQQALQLRAETAVLFAQNKPVETLVKAEETIRKLNSQLPTGVVQAEMAWMEEMIQLVQTEKFP